MAKRNQVTTAGRFFIARHIRPTSTAGTAMCHINLKNQKKEARQTTGFSNAGVTTIGLSTTRQPAVEGQRTPGQRGSSGFQLETADGGGDTLPKPFLCPVFSRPPAGKNGHGNGSDGSASI